MKFIFEINLVMSHYDEQKKLEKLTKTKTFNLEPSPGSWPICNNVWTKSCSRRSARLMRKCWKRPSTPPIACVSSITSGPSWRNSVLRFLVKIRLKFNFLRTSAKVPNRRTAQALQATNRRAWRTPGDPRQERDALEHFEHWVRRGLWVWRNCKFSKCLEIFKIWKF